VALPLASVTADEVVALAANVPLAPVVGRVKVTVLLGTRLPYWSVTVATKALAKLVLMTAT
jgi:hypothetical protein